MVRWHHQFNRHEFVQIAKRREGQINPVCCSLWGSKESDMLSNLTTAKITEKFPKAGK